VWNELQPCVCGGGVSIGGCGRNLFFLDFLEFKRSKMAS
jgi:hypothetical protein